MPNRFLTIDNLADLPKPQWLIEGMFEQNSLVMVAGPSGNYKSFLAIDWSMCMASGRKWNNRPTVTQKVLYVLGEGKSNLLKRLESWMHYNQISPAERTSINQNFRVTFEVPQLAVKDDVTSMLARLVTEEFEPKVIIIDTFARSFVGMDENDAKDTGLWIEQADRLRQLGYTVIFLHHVGKNTEFGVKYRGSTAIMGAMDTAFNFVKDKDDRTISTLSCTKQKDHDDDFELYFKRLSVNPNQAEEGSMVLIPTTKMDERFTPEFKEKEAQIKTTILTLVKDQSFKTDVERAKELSKQTGLNPLAAQSRISREHRKYKSDLPQD